MSKWERIDFKDIKKGDTIKGVGSESGVATTGVVASVALGCARGGHGALIAVDTDHAIYRRRPKKPAFVLLDVPEEGRWIEATLQGGSVETFRVDHVNHGTFFATIHGAGDSMFINTSPIAAETDRDITSWRPIDPPTLPEPEGFGYVGYVTTENGEVWDVLRKGGGEYILVARSGGAYKWECWFETLALGTFAAVKP